MRPTFVVIDRRACFHNLSVLRQKAPKSKLLAMVKANAYGHGIDLLMPALQHADALGVCCLEEALHLRRYSFLKTIVIMQGFYTADELPEIATEQLTVVIHNQEQIALLKKTKLTRPIKIWLKIDTGMHRLGFLPEVFLEVYQQIKAMPHIDQEALIIMTHFSAADASYHLLNDIQRSCLKQVLAHLPKEKISASNSAALLKLLSEHDDWIRPGIAVYGISPFVDTSAKALHLKPVMTFKSQLISVKTIAQGEYVGYGARWQCPETMPVGIVTAGYADGYPRHAGNGTPVLVNGQRTQLIGTVSMDSLNIDLRPIQNPKVGDEVILWGDDLPIETIAQHANTIPYELVTKMNPRVKKILKQE